VLVENSQRVVYTGDLRLRPSSVAEKTEVRKCDILIVEATFGSPEYRFPEPTEVEQMLLKEIDAALNQDKVPIVRAYALGKAQEVIQLLNQRGYKVLTEPVIREYCDIYESFGVKIGPVQVLEVSSEQSAVSSPSSLLLNAHRSLLTPSEYAGSVLVLGGTATFRRVCEAIPKRRTIFVSGWGIDAGARFRYHVDVVIPLSDHADFYDLIDYVRRVEPREVLVTHGAPEFAAHLNQLGFKARYLKTN
jgi:putative mRNA 3-end processing factor